MPSEDHVESTLVWYDRNQPVDYWVDEITNFLEEYKHLNAKNRVECSFQKPPQKGQVCYVEFNDVFERCTSQYDYGFSKGTPCIFLKLNKVFIFSILPDVTDKIHILP